MSRYAVCLANACEENDSFECSLLIDPGVKSASKIERLLQRKILYPRQVRKIRDSQIVHIFDHSWADLIPHVPAHVRTVVTVHDLIPLRFPANLTTSQLARYSSWVSFLRDADAIISVSEYTKQEIISLLQIDGTKIHVIPNGVDLPSSSPKQHKRDTEAPFVIGSIGTIVKRKNLEIFPAALSILKKESGREIKLHRLGEMLSSQLASKIRSVIGPENLIEHGPAKDSEIAGFYSRIDCLAFPSSYEGFGLPLIEAMAMGVPVASSNTTSLPEIGGDIPFYFDPKNPGSMAAALSKILIGEYNEKRILAGIERSRTFSWKRTLREFFAVYQQVLGQK